MKKDKIAQGLTGLLATPQPTTVQEQPKVKKAKVDKQAICVTVPVDLLDDVKYIAYYDRKKMNAIVTDALTQYVNRWKPTEQLAVPENLKSKMNK